VVGLARVRVRGYSRTRPGGHHWSNRSTLLVTPTPLTTASEGWLQGRRKAVRSLNRSARRLGLPMDLLSEPLDDDGVEAWVYGRVHLRPPSWRDEPKRQLTYVVVMLMWAMAVWVLLTYVTLIRAMQGKEAEELLINTWGLGLLFEQVRVTCTYLPPMASRLRALSLRHERVPVGSPPQGSARNAACAHSRRKIL
jgi:hypothetical protein